MLKDLDITADMVKGKLNKPNEGKELGHDNIYTSVLKRTSNAICKPLTLITEGWDSP